MKTLEELVYFAPQSIEEAISLLQTHGKSAGVLAGGTDLISLMKDRTISPQYIVDLNKIVGLSSIKLDTRQGLIIGSMVNINTILESEVIKNSYLALYQSAKSFGTTQVRNMATIGGNICRSSPSADMVPSLLVFDARIKLVGLSGERVVQLHEFFTGPGQNVLNNEILTEIILPLPPEHAYISSFKKISRTAEDLAKANCAIKIVIDKGKCEQARIALGAVAPTPVRLHKAETHMIEKRLTASLIAETADKVGEEIAPITDIRSNANYRAYVSKVLVVRLITEAMKNLEKADQ